MANELRLVLRELRRQVESLTQTCFKGSPGPKGQSCESCEYGEMFDDDDGPEGYCRLWDVSVTRKSWCDDWTKSSRLKSPMPKATDDDPAPETQTPSQKNAAKKEVVPKNAPPPPPPDEEEEEPEEKPEEEEDEPEEEAPKKKKNPFKPKG